MKTFAVLLLILTVAGVLCGSRRWAAISFLIGCCYMTTGQGIVLGGANLPMVRMLVIAGIVRLLVKREGLAGGRNRMDNIMIIWTAWLLFASFFHVWTPGSGPKYTVGALINTTGFYFMMRSLCGGMEELRAIIRGLCVILAPVAVFMVMEQAFHWNVFSIFGGVPDVPQFRNGRFRAQGPFSHAILAGTVGASCFPLAIVILKKYPVASLIGIVSSVTMVLTCASSGPIMSLAFGIVGILLWYKRSIVVFGLKAFIPCYLMLMLVMERPPYFLISKIDLTGASTAWHRTFLIQQTIAHLDEWWLFGTDRTIHWMPNQGHISEVHTDITNQYIAYGVAGGLLCMGLVIVLMVLAFRTSWRISGDDFRPLVDRFFIWGIGASLFAHATSAISVGYFGQALFFFWFPIAVLSSFYSMPSESEDVQGEPPPSEGFDPGLGKISDKGGGLERI